MPTPVIVVASGGVPIVSTPRGTPMTPVAATLSGLPVTIVADATNIGGIPVNLIKEDLTSWP